MRVLVTGGTGFVGSHTVAALRSAGHEVRLLVRKPERIGAALEPLGIAEPIDYVVGDVTNRESVNRALAGCDAAVHAAAVYNLDARAAKMTKATNVPGTRVVLGRWCADHDRPAGWRRGTPRPTPERPDAALRDVLRGRYPLWPTGSFHSVDVRDVARAHAAVLTPGRGPRRYIVPGHRVDGHTFFATLRAVTGRRLPVVIQPSAAMLPLAWVASAAQRVLPFHLPADYEAVLITYNDTAYDDSRAREEFGIQPRPLDQALRDAVRWLYETRHISSRQAGDAAH